MSRAGTVAPLEKYFSGVNGKADRPIIADPENIELNRAQVQITALPKTAITLGRQRINLDDQRFVGSVGWRQNEQTFDSARIEWSGVENLKVDLTYAWNVRTIWGIDGRDGRPQGIDGDNVFANISYKTPFGTLTGFAYVVDAENAAVVRNASKTFGARFVGAYPVAKAFKLNYAASYASQTDSGRNPNDYQADYYLVEGGADIGAFKLGAGYEVLGRTMGSRRPASRRRSPPCTSFRGQRTFSWSRRPTASVMSTARRAMAGNRQALSPT
ncbi:alginate export family protein [Hankyongella ginsenosidimutans]|uniref:alginate export family protein n=1 Tax=Hankyongella ginsenosidimutans TaxID=1763828 RepID=UPI001FE9AD6C|nr:alginate export family protein [Hankyongella ginsenosidimutans]